MCGSTNNACVYKDGTIAGSPHTQALECLTSGGHVAYVSLEAAQAFFTNVRL